MWIFLVQKKLNIGIFDNYLAFLFRKMWYFHYGWASEASETILYSGRNHHPPKYFIKRYYIDTRVQKVAKSVEIRKVAKFVEIYYIRVKK